MGDNNSISLISLKNNLLVDSTYNSTKTVIINRIIELGLNNPKYRHDNEFLALVLNFIENLITKKHKISKKELAIDVMKSLFLLTDEEVEALSKNIDFLCAQYKIVRKISTYKLFCSGIHEIFFKKAQK